MYDTLVLCGGGMRALPCHTALVLALDHLNMRKNIRKVIGTSAGAVAALHVACFASGGEMLDMLFRQCTFDRLHVEITSLLSGNGLSCKKRLYDMVDAVLSASFGRVDMTMRQLHTATGIDLHCVVVEVTDIMHGSTYNDKDDDDDDDTTTTRTHERILNSSTVPDMLVRDAVVASAALPGLVEPVVYDNKYYVDGGSLYNLPLGEAPGESTLAVSLKVKTPTSGADDSMFQALHVLLGHGYIVSSTANRYVQQQRMGTQTNKATLFMLDPPVASAFTNCTRAEKLHAVNYAYDIILRTLRDKITTTTTHADDDKNTETDMHDHHAVVTDMHEHHAVVTDMHDHAVVTDMHDHAVVTDMHDHAVVTDNTPPSAESLTR